MRVAGDRPYVASVLREGDPQSGMAIAVTTAGIDAERGAEPAVALAALVSARLSARWPGAVVTPGWDGYRIRGGVAEEPAARVEAVRWALLTPSPGGAPPW